MSKTIEVPPQANNVENSGAAGYEAHAKRTRVASAARRIGHALTGGLISRRTAAAKRQTFAAPSAIPEGQVITAAGLTPRPEGFTSSVENYAAPAGYGPLPGRTPDVVPGMHNQVPMQSAVPPTEVRR